MGSIIVIDAVIHSSADLNEASVYEEWQVSTTERSSAAEETTSLSSEANLKFEDDLLTINMGALLEEASDSVNFPADFLQKKEEIEGAKEVETLEEIEGAKEVE